MLVGASVPSAAPLARAGERGAEVVQIHLSAPRVWRHPLARADAEDLASSGRVVAAHAAYLCNPASGNAEVRIKTAANLQATLDEAERCGIAGVVVHAGHAAGGGTMEDAIARWVEVAAALSSPVPLLIENTASGTTAPGRHLDDFARLLAALRSATDTLTIGTCFDTCHAWAGDPATATDPAGYVAAFVAATGGIDLLHVNDSKDAPGAGRDRHDNLGAGRMTAPVLEAMVRAAADAGAPAAIVETPEAGGGQQRDLALIRSWLR